MNFLFRIFVLLGTVFVMLLFAALIAPYFINWDEFTDEFEREATRIVGQRVQVSGETSIRLLPLPYLEFNGLEVGANTDGSPLMTVDRFSVWAELFPFLSGEVRIVEMDMLRPRVDLQVDEKGAVAWTSPTEPVVNPEQVNIENLRVSEGAMIVSGLTGGRQLTLDGINATVDAKSLLGPWRVEGTAQIEGAPSELKIQTGTYQEEGSIRLKIEAIRTEKPYKLLLDGPVRLKDDVLEWAGSFEITPFSAQRVGEMPVPSEPLPVVSEGLFVASPDLIEIPDYRLEIGPREDPYTITGLGQITIADRIFFRVDATGRQIDLDRIKAAEEVAGPDTLEGRIRSVRSILERVPVPLIDGQINMVLPALVAGDTYVRDVSTVIRPRSDGWDLRAFTAKFPGNTTLEAKGRLALREDFGFDGKIVLASRQPSGFASWISGEVDPTFRKLNIFGVEADVSLSERQASFDQMELRMDDAVLRGKMQRIASITKQPAIILKLRGNKVNVENLRAIYSLVQEPDEGEAVGHDLDIEVTAETLEAVLGGKDVLAEGVDGHVKIRDGAVSVERFNAKDFYGAQIESSGRIEDLLSKPNGNMRFALLTDDAAPVLAFSKNYLGENPFVNNLLVDRKLTSDTSLIVEVDTTAQEDGARGQVLASGSMGGTDIEMNFAFDGDFQDPDKLPISLVGNLNNKAPSILMQQVGLETMPVDLIGEPEGPMAIDLDLDGLTTGKLETQISVQLPETNLVAKGDVQSADWKSFDGALDVTIGSGNIAPYAVVAGLEVPGLSIDQNLPLSLAFNLSRSDGTVQVSDIAGQISGNTVAGTLKLESKEVARPRLSGKIDLDRLDLALVAESVLGQSSTLAANLVGDLGLDASTESFGEALYGGYDADLALSANQISYGDTLSGNNATLKLVMLDGAVDLQDMAFETLGGSYAGGIQLKNTNGTVLATLRYALADLDGDQVIRLLKMPDGLSGRISAQGTAEASAKSFEALIAGLSGNGLFELKDVTLQGLQPGGFDGVLLETGADGYEIVSERIRELVGEVILTSEIRIERLEAPFSINRGRLRVRNVSHPLPASRLNGDLEIGLPDGSLDAKLNILFDPGKREAIAGADPQLDIAWTGTLQAPERTLNTSPLEGYLSLRAFEQSQRRVETLEAKVLEKQRIQQQIAVAYAREKYLARNREEELEREGANEGARLNNASRLFLDDLKRREEDELKRQEEQRKREAEERRKREEEEARIQAEVEARLEAERKAQEEARRLEAERQAKEEAERKAREEALRLEAERKAKEEAERQAKLKQEREEAERKAQEEAERQKRLEAERKAQQERKPEEEVPLDVQNMLREDIIQNLENFLGGGQN